MLRIILTTYFLKQLEIFRMNMMILLYRRRNRDFFIILFNPFTGKESAKALLKSDKDRTCVEPFSFSFIL